MAESNAASRLLLITLSVTCLLLDVCYIVINRNDMLLEQAEFLEPGEGNGSRRQILFLETSGILTVGARVACALESASRLHPQWSIHYLHSATRLLSPSCPFCRLVRTFPNVRVAYLDYTSHFKDTALDLWLREGAYKRGPYEMVHISDGLRLGLLLKHGGVYVDLDVIFLRSLSGAGDALVAQSAADSVTNNFLAFPARHSFVNECLAEFVSGYYPKDWGYNGPRMIRKTLLRWCNASRVEEALGSTDRCRGVTLLPQARLLPLNHTLARMLFEAAAWRNVSEAFARSHLVHTFNSLTRGISAQPGSFVDRAARQNCPRSFRLANELYGMF